MRYFEEASRVAAKMLGLKGDDKDPKAIETINETYAGLLEVSSEWLREQPVEAIVEALTNQRGFNADKLEATAELLFWEGTFQQNLGATEIADLCFPRALRLLEHLDQTAESFSMQRNERIKHLRTLIA